MKLLPNLTPLRFFLAFLVFIYHLANLCRNVGLPYFNEWPVFHKGVEAVYMFFTLSGFLIIGITYRSKVAGNFSIKNFYMRRILRILPLYYLIIILGFTFYHFLLPLANVHYENKYDLSTGLLLTIFFLPNVFSTFDPGGILEVLWSIGIEEQFYLMIAPLMFLLNKNKILITLTTICTLYFLLYHNNFGVNVFHKYKFVYFFLFAGGIIAIMEEKNMLSFLKRSKFISITVVVLTVLFFTTDLLVIENMFLSNLSIMVLFSLFIYTISYANFNIEIKNKTLDYLGKISYGIYMYHFVASTGVAFLFQAILSKIYLPDWVSILSINIITLLFSILLSHLSYKYFESYFLKLKMNYRRY